MTKKREPLIGPDGEVRELTAEDIREFKPIREAGLPPSLLKKLGVRGPQVAPTKVRINIRFSPEVVTAFKATGPGWQSRMDEALKTYLKEHVIA
jgi:uncharacterized protein (DUF4415 family)